MGRQFNINVKSMGTISLLLNKYKECLRLDKKPSQEELGLLNAHLKL